MHKLWYQRGGPESSTARVALVAHENVFRYMARRLSVKHSTLVDCVLVRFRVPRVCCRSHRNEEAAVKAGDRGSGLCRGELVLVPTALAGFLANATCPAGEPPVGGGPTAAVADAVATPRATGDAEASSGTVSGAAGAGAGAGSSSGAGDVAAGEPNGVSPVRGLKALVVLGCSNHKVFQARVFAAVDRFLAASHDVLVFVRCSGGCTGSWLGWSHITRCLVQVIAGAEYNSLVLSLDAFVASRGALPEGVSGRIVVDMNSYITECNAQFMHVVVGGLRAAVVATGTSPAAAKLSVACDVVTNDWHMARTLMCFWDVASRCEGHVRVTVKPYAAWTTLVDAFHYEDVHLMDGAIQATRVSRYDARLCVCQFVRPCMYLINRSGQRQPTLDVRAADTHTCGRRPEPCAGVSSRQCGAT